MNAWFLSQSASVFSRYYTCISKHLRPHPHLAILIECSDWSILEFFVRDFLKTSCTGYIVPISDGEQLSSLVAQLVSAMAKFSLRLNVHTGTRGSRSVAVASPAGSKCKALCASQCISMTITNHIFCTRPYCSDQSDELG